MLQASTDDLKHQLELMKNAEAFASLQLPEIAVEAWLWAKIVAY